MLVHISEVQKPFRAQESGKVMIRMNEMELQNKTKQNQSNKSSHPKSGRDVFLGDAAYFG